MNAPLHHPIDDGTDQALADALLDKALAGERYIASGKVPANAIATYRREVTLLRSAAARLAARPALTLPATIVDQVEDPYHAFLQKKIPVSEQDGFEIEVGEINPALKDFTRLIVQWALRGGRRGLFLNFGLHKTVTQIEMARLAVKHGKGPALIVLPLGVRHEFFDDAEHFFKGEYAVRLIFINDHAGFANAQRDHGDDIPTICLTNYEPVRDGKLDPKVFGFVSLDEAAVLRGYGTKTFQTFLPLFAGVPLRFVATATPSPNRTKELIHYAGYLGIMDTGQALTRFFQRNSSKAGDLQLYPHKEDEFWTWVHSWALFLQSPADLGFDDTEYRKPPLKVVWHEVASDHSQAQPENDGQGVLLKMPAMGLQQAAKEKRDSMPARIAKMCDIIAADPATHRILWHHLEAEREAIEAAVPGARSIFGSQDRDLNERNAVDFKYGRFKDLATKPSMSGAGCNFQHHCHEAIFPGINFEFHDFIQAIMRLWRFGQLFEVLIHIIHTEAERGVVAVLKEKWAEHDLLMARMAEIIRKYGLNHAPAIEALKRSIGVTRIEVAGRNFVVANNDCVAEARHTKTGSVGLIVTSVPFSNHYEYTAQYEDFGHTDDNHHFWAQMDFLTPELIRILQPGRLACIHVKDRVLFGAVTGAGVPTISPFHAEAIFHCRKHGFDYMGMITIVTDVVRENNATYRLGWSENAKDSSKMGVGSPEYVILMRKPQSDRGRGYADTPVTKLKPATREVVSWNDATDARTEQVPGEGYSLARWQIDAHALWRSSGDRMLSPKEFADAIRQLGMEQITAIFEKFSLSEIYDHEYIVALGEHLGDRLPKTFMALSPASAHPAVWHDINRMRTLNSNQAARRAQLHICLARGSRVLTRERGYIPIETVSVGEQVLTHKGRWRPVLVKQNTGVRPVVTIRAHGVPGLTLTPDHKLWTRAVRKLPWSRMHSRLEASRSEPEWLEASETVGSYINLKLPTSTKASVEELGYWWIVGRWIADGHVGARNSTFVISCGHHEREFLIARLGRFAGTPKDVGTAVQIPLRDPGEYLRRILRQCGKGAVEKQLPPEAFTLPLVQARALLDGYLSGDGHWLSQRDRWMATSVSRDLLLGIALLAQRAYGAVASIYPGRPAGTAVIQGRAVSTRQEWVLSFDIPDPERRKGNPFVLDDGAWKKVRSVEPAGEIETWNLRVADDESFTAEGCIVKNCPLQFDIVDRLITRYSNAGDLVYDPFCGLGTVPLRAMTLGRRGAGSELDPVSFKDSVHYLQAFEAGQNLPSLFDVIDRVEVAA